MNLSAFRCLGYCCIWLQVLLLSMPAVALSDQASQIEKLRREIERTLKEEEEALGQLSEQTLDLDGQVKAVEELKMLKADLDILRQQRTGIETGNEKALGQLDKVAAEIIHSAEQVQMAQTDAEVEVVMAVARDKVQKVRQEFALGLKKARQSASSELEAISRTLNDLHKKFARQFAANDRITAQYDALILELRALGKRLIKPGGFGDEKEIVTVFNVIREKIRILTLNISLLARDDEPVAENATPAVAGVLEADNATDDVFTTAPIEELEFLYNLQQLKTEVAFLYFNTLTYNFQLPATAIMRVMLLVAVLLLGAATFRLLVCVRGGAAR